MARERAVLCERKLQPYECLAQQECQGEPGQDIADRSNSRFLVHTLMVGLYCKRMTLL
jgi:hypothetical protein